MKDTVRTTAPPRAVQPARAETRQAATRIKLALLDQYAAGYEHRGYDPYNAQSQNRAIDYWQTKPKRR